MGFFDTIKQGLGIGTLEATLDVPAQIAGSAGKVEGTLHLAAKSDQEVKEVTVTFEMIRSWEEIEQRPNSSGGSESYASHQSRTYTLGQFRDAVPFAIKAGEVKAMPFTIAFTLADPASLAKEVLGEGELGSIVGALSKISSVMNNERYEYRVGAKATLEGTLLNPSDSKEVVVI